MLHTNSRSLHSATLRSGDNLWGLGGTTKQRLVAGTGCRASTHRKVRDGWAHTFVEVEVGQVSKSRYVPARGRGREADFSTRCSQKSRAASVEMTDFWVKEERTGNGERAVPLLVAEGDHGIDFGGSVSGEPGGYQGDD
jgi:hypothetical protein